MSKEPSLFPKEHGAYAELAFPLVTGLALSWPSLQALALGGAAVAFFLANEPAAVLLGARGKRIREQIGPQARKRGAILLGSGILLGGTGVLGAGSLVWPEILLPLLAGALLVPMVLAGRHKSVLGELLVVTAFSTLLLPLSRASGADPGRAAAAVAVWWVSFSLGTLEVHAIKARHKKRGRSNWTRWASPLACGVTVLLASAVAFGFLGPPSAGGGPPAGGYPHSLGGATGNWSWAQGVAPFLAASAAAVLPPSLAILTLAVFQVHPKRLKRVGWTLVGANSVALVILLMG